MSSIQAKIAIFRRIREDTNGLALWVNHKSHFPLPLRSFKCELICPLSIQITSRIDLNKSRQVTALYILTVVAVTFMPLSFISSILRLNTTDVQHTDRHLWAFWVTAVLINILLLGLSLLVVRYFESTREALSMFWGGRNPDNRDMIGPQSQQQSYSHYGQVDPSKMARGPIFRPQHNTVPTYIKVHRKWLSPSTLDEYELPWEWDDVRHLWSGCLI